MRILITGGFGFVGGRLAQHLQQAGHHVILGSRHATRTPAWLSRADVAQTEWHDLQKLEAICRGVDVIVHAAGMNAQDCAADPAAALEFNGAATARLVVAASRAGVKRFIYLSTAHIYASPLVGIITEETCPHNLHPYATSHLAGENAVLGAGQGGQIEGIVLRLSNAFGAPTHNDANCWMLLVNDLCRQAVQTKQMVLNSNGLQQRDFIPLAEVSRAIEKLVSCGLATDVRPVFNLCSGASMSVFDMAQLIQQRCRLVLGFEPILIRPDIGTSARLDALELKVARLNALGFTPDLDVSVEIDALLQFCRQMAEPS